MLKIVTVPDPILRKTAEKINKVDEEVKNLIAQMRETLEKNPRGGIGLAAPQVGRRQRIIITKDGREPESITYALVNPEITKTSTDRAKAYEGCLSIPDTYCLVERPEKVVVKALNQNGKKITIKASDLLARVLQHEIDHLNGILITDKSIGNILTEKEYNKLINSMSTA